jgi:iron complex outermembrane receptor protein
MGSTWILTLTAAIAPYAYSQAGDMQRPDEIITVTEKKPEKKAFTGALGDRSILETPYSVHTYGSDRIEEEQQVTANQVLRHEPALTNVSTPGGFTGFNLSFRGFPSGADAISFYGMGPGAMFSGSLGQLYSVERIEVVKGPSAGLGSFSPSAAVGGSVNIVPKLPFDQSRSTVSLGVRERGIVSAHLDINRKLGDRTAVRLNLASEGGATFYRGRDERDVAALAFSQKIGQTVELILGYDQMRIRSEGYQNAFVLVPGVAVPKAPNPSRNHFQKWTWLEQEWNYGYASLRWNLAEDWNLFVQGLYGIRRRPILSSGTALIRNEEGELLLRPNYLAKGTRYKPFFGSNIFLNKRFVTGPWKHDLTLAHLSHGFKFMTAQGEQLATIPSHLYHPIYVERPALATVAVGPSSEVNASTQALSDDIQLSDELSLVLGVKSSVLRADSYDVETREKTLHRKDKGTTPFGGLSYRIGTQSMAYLSYAEGLERGGMAPASAANADEIMAPVRNHQFELGFKSEELQGVLLTAALFQIERGLEYLDATSNIYEQNGLQRNRGLELNASGSVNASLNMQAGVLLLEPRIVRGEHGHNKKAPGAPNMTLPFTLDYRWTESWSLSTSILHFGKQFIDPENSRSLKAWTRFDAGLRFSLRMAERPVTLQARVENIGNQRYWASAAGGQLVLGSPEIWKLALRTEI